MLSARGVTDRLVSRRDYSPSVITPFRRTLLARLRQKTAIARRQLCLLAGDSVLVTIEPPVVRHRKAIEPVAAPERGDRGTPGSLVSCVRPAHAVRIRLVQRSSCRAVCDSPPRELFLRVRWPAHHNHKSKGRARHSNLVSRLRLGERAGASHRPAPPRSVPASPSSRLPPCLSARSGRRGRGEH